MTSTAGRFRRGELDPDPALDPHIRPVAIQRLAGRAGARKALRIVGEVAGLKARRPGLRRLVFVGVGEARVALAEQGVGDVGVALLRGQPRQVLAAVKARVGGQLRLGQDVPGQPQVLEGLVSFDQPLRQAREQFEKAYLDYQLAKNTGNVSKMAKEAVGAYLLRRAWRKEDLALIAVGGNFHLDQLMAVQGDANLGQHRF